MTKTLRLAAAAVSVMIAALCCDLVTVNAGTITGTPGKIITPIGKDSTGAWNVFATDAQGNLIVVSDDVSAPLAASGEAATIHPSPVTGEAHCHQSPFPIHHSPFTN